MQLDLRYPLGMLFTVFGVILGGYGLIHPELRAPMTTANVNLYTGLGMLAFGLVMLWLAWRAESRRRRGAGS